MTIGKEETEPSIDIQYPSLQELACRVKALESYVREERDRIGVETTK